MKWNLSAAFILTLFISIALVMENRPAKSDGACDVNITVKDWRGRGVEGIVVTLEEYGGGASTQQTTVSTGIALFPMNNWPTPGWDCEANEGWYTASFYDDCDPPNYFEDDVYFDGFSGLLTFNNVNLCDSK
jgi:hypothetical protein